MHLEKNNKIVITNKVINDFVREHEDREMILRTFDNLLVNFCMMSKTYLENETIKVKEKNESNNLVNFVECFEKRQSKMYDELLVKLESVSVDIDKTVSSAGTIMTERISCKVSEMMLSFQQIVTSSLSKVNMEEICANLKLSICGMLNDGLVASNEKLENKLRVELEDKIVKPLMSTQNKMYEQLCELPSMLKSCNYNFDEVLNQLGSIELKLKCEYDKMNVKVESLSEVVRLQMNESMERIRECKMASEDQQKNVMETIKTLPNMTKGVFGDVVLQLNNKSNDIMMTISEFKNQLELIKSETKGDVTQQVHNKGNEIVTMVKMVQGQLEGVKKDTRDMNILYDRSKEMNEKLECLERRMLEKATKIKHSTNVKGCEGEDKLFELLSEGLMTRDGYRVEKVNGQARSCDIVIKRDCFSDIRIESKAHGKDTNEKVRYVEVEKFRRDLMNTNDHGIFVSLYSEIVGVSNFEIQQLATGKFAIYLANNCYNIDVILDMIRLIYRLDDIVKTRDNNEFKITKEKMTQVQSYVKDYGDKIQKAKNNMKETLRILNDVQVNLIERILLNEEIVQKTNTTSTVVGKEDLVCPRCEKVLRNKSAYTNHVKNLCRKNV